MGLTKSRNAPLGFGARDIEKTNHVGMMFSTPDRDNDK